MKTLNPNNKMKEVHVIHVIIAALQLQCALGTLKRICENTNPATHLARTKSQDESLRCDMFEEPL